MADYCTDTFKMVEDNEDSFRMWQGLVGPYYVPIMSNDGTLRWSNNGGLPNPSEVNLMGPQGAGIRIAGIRESAEELPATAPAGDIWLVGEGSPYEGYSFTGGEWLDLGPLTVGPAGPPGPQGDDYDLTEADKQEIAEISEGLLLSELDNDPLAIRYGGTGAHDLAGAKANLDIDDIEDKMGTWPLGTDAQDVAGAINEMIGEISLQVADIAQLKDNFAGEFSPTSTYAVGTYVVYGGAFWRCTTAVTTAGSWTGASNWTQVTAGGEFVDVRGIIGTSPLNTTAQTLTGAINEHETDISALDTALNGKVSKAGDTMSGNLNLNNSSLDISTTPSETAWGNAYYTVRDKNGNDIGRFRAAQFSDGRCGVQILGRNGSVENALRLLAKQDGTIQVLVSDSAAWRSALETIKYVNITGTDTESGASDYAGAIKTVLTSAAPQAWARGSYAGTIQKTNSGTQSAWSGQYILNVAISGANYGTQGSVAVQGRIFNVWYQNGVWFVNPVNNDSGNNYCKMPDGTLIQWGNVSTSSEVAANSSGQATITLPLPFTSTTYSVVALQATSIPCSRAVGYTARTTNSITFSFQNTTSQAAVMSASWMAIGRWK